MSSKMILLIQVGPRFTPVKDAGVRLTFFEVSDNGEHQIDTIIETEIKRIPFWVDQYKDLEFDQSLLDIPTGRAQKISSKAVEIAKYLIQNQEK